MILKFNYIIHQLTISTNNTTEYNESINKKFITPFLQSFSS